MDHEFWENLEKLIPTSSVVIDRLKGSAHPCFPDVTYPLDYGYLKDTTSPDGGGIDVWIGDHKFRRPKAVICTVDLNKRDVEIKILIGCSQIDIQRILDFHNSGKMRAILIRRDEEMEQNEYE
jgi:inorganic pyrophosphatase